MNETLVMVEDSRGISAFNMKTYSMNHDRKLYLYGEITEELINALAMQITYLQGISRDPITIVINSAGGSVLDGMVLVDLIGSSEIPIDIVVAGKAMSMAAVILAAGKKGHRHMLKSSQILIHEPRIPYGGGGTTTEIETRAESLKATRNMTSEILARNTGHTLDEVNELIRGKDIIFNAEQAIEWGIVDDIVDKI